MEKRKKIVFCSNALWLKTGLSRNARAVLSHLYNTGKYEIIQYCQGVLENDANLEFYPWKCYGTIPADQNLINQLNQDEGLKRRASYGSLRIDKVIELEKPDVLVLSDDIWAFPAGDFLNKPYINKDFKNPEKNLGCHIIHHLTADSLPLLPDLLEIASRSKTYCWASFAEKELKKIDQEKYSHVGTIGGAIDSKCYSPISQKEKEKLREKFGIDKDCKIFFYLGRNQLRKQYNILFKALASFKSRYPNKKAKVLVHCSWTEGWPLKRIMDDLGLSKEDVLTTYVCRKCGEWEIKPYSGEDQDCRFCGTQKSQCSSNVQYGVPEDEMKLIYGISDASVSLHTSGGFEYHQAQSLFCGIPLATVEYSCGSDFTEQSFVYSLNYFLNGECNTGFWKSTPDVNSVVNFMNKISDAKQDYLDKIAFEGIRWAKSNFSEEAIGKKWEKVLDELPFANWDGFEFKYKPKNENYRGSELQDNKEWIKDLYKQILYLKVDDNDSGVLHWLDALTRGYKREDILAYFVDVAKKENQKNKPFDINSIVEKNDKKKLLMVCKESGGDIYMISSLFESCRQQYPNHELYFACDISFAPLLKGNPFIDRVIQYQPFMENELMMISHGGYTGPFDVYMNIPIFTQRQLNYLSNNNAILPKSCQI